MFQPSSVGKLRPTGEVSVFRMRRVGGGYLHIGSRPEIGKIVLSPLTNRAVTEANTLVGGSTWYIAVMGTPALSVTNIICDKEGSGHDRIVKWYPWERAQSGERVSNVRNPRVDEDSHILCTIV